MHCNFGYGHFGGGQQSFCFGNTQLVDVLVNGTAASAFEQMAYV